MPNFNFFVFSFWSRNSTTLLTQCVPSENVESFHKTCNVFLWRTGETNAWGSKRFWHHSQYCFTLSHFCNNQGICPFIGCTALGAAEGMNMCWAVMAGGYWAFCEVSQGTEGFSVWQPWGPWGLWPHGTGTWEGAECSSRSFYADGNWKAAGASSASQNKAPTSVCDLSANTILLWSVHTLLSRKTATRKKPLTSLDVLQSGSEWALLPLKGLFYPNHCPWFFLPRGNPFVLWFLKLIRFLWSDIRVFQQK